MPDGLEITLQEVIYHDDERMQTYIERRGVRVAKVVSPLNSRS